jgi:FkbM family methyltransferase
MKRFFRWQFGSRILGTPAIVPFVENAVLVVEPGMTGATGNIYCGLHEFNDMALLLHFLREEDSFVDVGANIGSYSVLAAAVCQCKVIALEPVPETFKKLERNLRMNRIESLVDARQMAAGESAGSIRFTADLDTANKVAPAGYAGRIIEVPGVPLDALVADFPAAMWKVDVEGFEEAVLRGAPNVLNQESLLVVLLEGDSPMIESTMHSAGFKRSAYNPINREFTVGSSSSQTHNQLWVRALEKVAAKCKAARNFEVLGVKF